jgi:hypothetical protein
MKRRALFGRLAATVAAVAVAPAVQAEAAMIGTGPHANWYLEQTDRGMWQIIDQRTGDVYAGPPTVEMLDALQSAARAEGYNRGHDVASARAESRAALTYPMDFGGELFIAPCLAASGRCLYTPEEGFS